MPIDPNDPQALLAALQGQQLSPRAMQGLMGQIPVLEGGNALPSPVGPGAMPPDYVRAMGGATPSMMREAMAPAVGRLKQPPDPMQAMLELGGGPSLAMAVGPAKSLIQSLGNRLKSESAGAGFAPEGMFQVKKDPDLSSIMKRGQLWEGKEMAQDKDLCKEGECHWNVANLLNNGKIDTIGLGYAKNPYGWVQHTWGIKDNKVIETNPHSGSQNSQYFGVALTPGEAQGFTKHVLANAPGKGMVRTLKGGSQLLQDQ